MKKLAFILIIFQFFLTRYNICYAQSTGVITGKVTDEQSGETLIGTTVAIQGDKATATNVEGGMH